MQDFIYIHLKQINSNYQYFKFKHKAPKMNQIHVVDHPLIHHKMALIRQSSTSMKHIRELIEEVSIILAYECTKKCELKQITINTPFENMTAQKMVHDIVLVIILRAGIGMLSGFLKIIPNAKIGYLGIYRNEQNLRPVEYYLKLPNNLTDTDVFLLDPMLATGGSAVYAISLLKKQGAQHINLVCLITAPEGVEFVKKKHPDIEIYTAVLDRELNKKGYILPGLGDAGDRLMGTTD